MKNLHIIMYVSNRCNRSCPECYYPHGDGVMTSEVMDKVSNWIISTCQDEKVKWVKVNFLGGEPIMDKEIIFSILNKLEEGLPFHTRAHPEYKYSVFTNGDFITSEFLHKAKQFDLRVCINPATASLGEVEDKIQKVLSVLTHCGLAPVFDELNMGRAKELAELAVKYDCSTLRINRLYDGANREGYLTKYKKAMHDVFDVLLFAPKPIYPNSIMETTYPVYPGTIIPLTKGDNPYCCGSWLAIIDWDGTLRSCNPDLSTVVGHIDTHKFSDLRFPQRWSAEGFEECQVCQWVDVCQAGCPYTRKLTYGTYNKKTPFCEAFKELFPRLFQLTEKWRNYKISSIRCIP